MSNYVHTTHPKVLKASRRREALKSHYYRTSDRKFSTDAAEVRDHIDRLIDAGFSANSIAVVAGCASDTVVKIHRGIRTRVNLYIATGIFKVGMAPVPAQAASRVPAIGAIRRIQALMRMGWTATAISEEAGRGPYSASNLLNTRFAGIEYEVWDAYRTVYDRLSLRPGPSLISRKRAKARGYPSPMDWETANIDDPDSFPASDDDGRTVTQRNRAAGISYLRQGLLPSQVAKRVGVTVKTAQRWANELKENGEEQEN